MKSIFLTCILGMTLAFSSFEAKSEQEEGSVPKIEKPELVRVGGDYIVNDITKTESGTFRIEFKGAQPGGKYGTIILDSDHVHVAVIKGQKLRISAEIARVNGDVAEATQVLVFIPNIRGPMPVWLLSSRSKNLDLRGSKYLDMHAPLSDYNIL